jgi:hypothetical protein
LVTNVSTLEITDHTGTVYARHDVRVRLEYQDQGRALVVHVEDREDSAETSEDYFRKAGETIRAALAASRKTRVA